MHLQYKYSQGGELSNKDVKTVHECDGTFQASISQTHPSATTASI